mmetsp:Transcript_2965/g.7355  ORF Transcript_2965/g.7355 Transcript_2965/m.7355 type:complete len:404 (-) Transcript_2965:1865-3076(-)
MPRCSFCRAASNFFSSSVSPIEAAPNTICLSNSASLLKARMMDPSKRFVFSHSSEKDAPVHHMWTRSIRLVLMAASSSLSLRPLSFSATRMSRRASPICLSMALNANSCLCPADSSFSSATQQLNTEAMSSGAAVLKAPPSIISTATKSVEISTSHAHLPFTVTTPSSFVYFILLKTRNRAFSSSLKECNLLTRTLPSRCSISLTIASRLRQSLTAFASSLKLSLPPLSYVTHSLNAAHHGLASTRLVRCSKRFTLSFIASSRTPMSSQTSSIGGFPPKALTASRTDSTTPVTEARVPKSVGKYTRTLEISSNRLIDTGTTPGTPPSSPDRQGPQSAALELSATLPDASRAASPTSVQVLATSERIIMTTSTMNLSGELLGGSSDWPGGGRVRAEKPTTAPHP